MRGEVGWLLTRFADMLLGKEVGLKVAEGDKEKVVVKWEDLPTAGVKRKVEEEEQEEASKRAKMVS
jgi:hypothetical protein